MHPDRLPVGVADDAQAKSCEQVAVSIIIQRNPQESLIGGERTWISPVRAFESVPPFLTASFFLGRLNIHHREVLREQFFSDVARPAVVISPHQLRHNL